ncbi:MAG: hypothetical protein Q4B43_01985 [Bacteroidota bacterium]|nr:hypothetical protein [Bacteroidota bacterium]
MKKELFLALSLLSWGTILGQIGTPFEKRIEKQVKGDLVLISNNSLNKGKKSNKAYNQVDNKARLNDILQMKHIDIDNDKSTFSSSSAILELDNPEAKITYAGLYWSATYKYEEGKLYGTQFEATNPKREAVNQIKIKLPNQKKYIDIEGEVIFDGHKKKSFSSNAPYAAYADITDYIQELQNPNGEYTVANIRATQGTLSGGSSAGWTLVFIIEDPNKPHKFISIYDGFVGVSDNEVDINYSGFQTPASGKVNARIFGSALEGDLGMRGDYFMFKHQGTKEYIYLQEDERSKDNFFNSSITLKHNNRKPNSMNTLGYDTFSIAINNPNNSVIKNNAEEVDIRLHTKGDRYFMFMTALDIEAIPEDEMPQKQTEELLADADEVEPEHTDLLIASTDTKPVDTIEMKPEVTTPVVAQPKTTTTKPNTNQSTLYNTISERVIPIESASVTIDGIESGYYVVANVFAVHNNATRFVKKMQDKNIAAQFFINPANKYRYVHLGHAKDFQTAQQIYFSDINGKYKDALWIMSVNIDTQTVTINNKKYIKQTLRTTNVTPKS